MDICHTVIHRKLQNVVYMKKSRCLLKKKRKKKGGNIGSCPQVPVMLYVVLTMPTLNKAYLYIYYLFIEQS